MIFLKKPPQNVSSYQTAVALITEMLLAGTKGLKLGVLLSSPLVWSKWFIQDVKDNVPHP